MNTLFLTKNSVLLRLVEFLQTHLSSTSTPLQEDALNQGNSSFTQYKHQYKQKRQNIQQVYYLERRCFL